MNSLCRHFVATFLALILILPHPALALREPQEDAAVPALDLRLRSSTGLEEQFKKIGDSPTEQASALEQLAAAGRWPRDWTHLRVASLLHQYQGEVLRQWGQSAFRRWLVLAWETSVDPNKLFHVGLSLLRKAETGHSDAEVAIPFNEAAESLEHQRGTAPIPDYENAYSALVAQMEELPPIQSASQVKLRERIELFSSAQARKILEDPKQLWDDRWGAVEFLLERPGKRPLTVEELAELTEEYHRELIRKELALFSTLLSAIKQRAAGDPRRFWSEILPILDEVSNTPTEGIRKLLLKKLGEPSNSAAPAPSQTVLTPAAPLLRAALAEGRTTLDRLRILMKFSDAETAGDFERMAQLGKNTVHNFLRGGAFGPGTRRRIQGYVLQNFGVPVTLHLRVLGPNGIETRLNALASPDERYDFIMNEILGWTYGELRKRSRAGILRADKTRSLPREKGFSRFKQAKVATQRLTRYGLEQGLREEFRRSVWLDGQLRAVSQPAVPDILHSLPDVESRFNWLMDEWLLISSDELLEELGISDAFSVSIGRFMTPTGSDSERRTAIRQALEQKLQARTGEAIRLDENLLPETPPPATKVEVAIPTPRKNHLPNGSELATPAGVDLGSIQKKLRRQRRAGARLRALREMAGYASRQRFADETGVSSWTILRFEQNETSMQAANRAAVRSFLEARYATLGIALGLDQEFRVTEEPLTNRIAAHETAADRLAFISNDLLGWTYPELTRQAQAASKDFLGKELTFSSNRSITELLNEAGPSTRRLIRHVVETALRERYGESPRFDHEFMPVESVSAQLAQIPDFESRFNWLRKDWLMWDKNELMKRAGVTRLKHSMERAVTSTGPRNTKKMALVRALTEGLRDRGDAGLRLNGDLLPVIPAGLEEKSQDRQWKHTHAKIVKALRSHPGGLLMATDLAKRAGVGRVALYTHNYRSLVAAENKRRAGMKRPRLAIELREYQEHTEDPEQAIVKALRSHPGGRMTVEALAKLAGVGKLTLYNYNYRSLVEAENQRRAGMKRPRPAIILLRPGRPPSDAGLEERTTRSVSLLRQMPPAVPGSIGDAALVFMPGTYDLAAVAAQMGAIVVVPDDGPEAAGLEELLRAVRIPEGRYAVGVLRASRFLEGYPRQILIEDRPEGFEILGLRWDDLPPPVSAALESVLAYLDRAVEA